MEFHFDINGTILGIDSFDKKPLRDSLLELFCRSIDVKGNYVEDFCETYYSHNRNIGLDKNFTKNVLDVFPHLIEDFERLLNNFPMGLFESFIEVINKYIKTNKGILILRTFGSDGGLVRKILKDDHDIELIDCNPSQIKDYRDKHLFVQEDYKRWNQNKKKVEFGKIIEKSDRIVYGFDDNNCMHTDDLEVNIFRVNAIRAMSDKDYFLNKLL